MSRLHQYYQPMGWAKMRRLPLMARVMSLERPPRRIPNAWIGSSEDSALGSQGCGQNPGTTEMKGFVHLQKQLETFLFLGNCKGGLSKSKHVQTNMLHYCTICVYIGAHILLDLFSNLDSFTLAGHLLVSQLKWSWYHLWNVRDPQDIFSRPKCNWMCPFWQVDGLWSCFLVAWSLHGLKGHGLAALFRGFKGGNNGRQTFADFRKQQRASKRTSWIASKDLTHTTKLNGGRSPGCHFDGKFSCAPGSPRSMVD